MEEKSEFRYAEQLGVAELVSFFVDVLKTRIGAGRAGQENVDVRHLKVTNEQLKRANFALEYDVPWLGAKIGAFYVDISNRIHLCQLKTEPIPSAFLARFTALVKHAKDQNRAGHVPHLVSMVREHLGSLKPRLDCKRVADIATGRGYNCASAAKLLKSVLHDAGVEIEIEIGYLRSQFHCWNVVQGELVDLTQQSELPKEAYVPGFAWGSVQREALL